MNQMTRNGAASPMIRIGRGVDCDIIVDDRYASVSRHHAIIYREGNGYVFVDDSSNGTLINNQRIHHGKQYVYQGDQIVLGRDYLLNWSEIRKFFPELSGATRIETPSPALVTSYGPVKEQPAPPAPAPAAERVDGWNWGAFYFGWLWAVCNGIYWPLVVLIPYIGWAVALIVNIILGINGNRWAWEAKHWDSLEAFRRTQHNWAVAALIFFLIAVFGGIVFFFVVAGALASL